MISCDQISTLQPSYLSYSNESNGSCSISGEVLGVITGEYEGCNSILTQTWSFTDECGRTITQSQTITIYDNTAPTFTAPADITIYTDENCQYDASVSVTGDVTDENDNCSTGLEASFTDVVSEGECSGSYIITRTWTLTDECGNAAIAQNQIITVLDNISPVWTSMPTDLTVECDGNGNTEQLNAWLTGYTGQDNCSEVTLTNNYTGLSNICGSTGSAEVLFTLSDECGNSTSTTATFTIVDTQVPVIIVPANISVNNDPGICGAQVNIPVATANDNCGSATVSNNITGTNNASGLYEVGTTTIIWTATDACGNTSTAQTIVTVEDSEIPHIICPQHITVNATSGACGADITVPAPIVSDNCEIRKVVNSWNNTNDASGFYPVGTTIVWWTVVDMSGNTDNCFMNITVIDTEAPSIICPDNITVNNDPGVCEAMVTVPVPEANDNCGIGNLVNSFNGTADASDIYPVGTTTITWTAIDLNGNEATCTMTITVNDIEAPSIICPTDVTVSNDLGECGANVTIPQPEVDDKCGIKEITNSFTGTSDASGFYPIGMTAVTWTVIDNHDNTSTCIMNVIVTDSEKPLVNCPTNIVTETMPGECGANVTIPVPDVDDNCGVVSITNNFNNTGDASGYYTSGLTVVTWTVTDIHGNESICDMTVLVQDHEAPSIICPENIEVTAGLNCEVYLEMPAPQVSDNCAVAEVLNDYNGSDNASGIYPAGTTIVNWTVNDVNGNTSNCSVIVTVIANVIAVDDYVTTNLNTSVMIPVLDNDNDCDNNINPSSVYNTTTPSNGSVVVDPLTGIFTYTPNNGFNGTDEFNYIVCDIDGLCDEATVYITVNAPTEKLVAVDDQYITEVNTKVEIDNLINDSYASYSPKITILDMPKHGTIELNTYKNTVIYIPNLDWTGIDDYTYILSDIDGAARPDTATTTITVVPAEPRENLNIYNLITPDGDGYNDTWVIEGIEEYSDNEVLLFNRWGDQIRYFEGYNNSSIVWDGTNKHGEILPAATYYYIIKIRSTQKIYTGWVVIHGK